MQRVDEPEVFLIASSQVHKDGMDAYLEKVGGTSWLERMNEALAPYAEMLIEFAGRLCYRSWEPGLNANVTKIREDRGEYLRNVLRSGHGSVLEHASFTFVIHNASRVLTAELNRHRAGVAISEQSLRFVRLDDLPFRLPPNVSEDTQRRMTALVEHIEDQVRAMYDAEGIATAEDFATKKQITSAIRRVAPMGLGTELVWTANVRAIRHVLTMRSAAGAEEEIRVFARRLYELVHAEAPLLFGDYAKDEDGSLITEFVKV